MVYTGFSEDAKAAFTFFLSQYLRHVIMEGDYNKQLSMGLFVEAVAKVERDFRATTAFNNSTYSM